MPTHPIPTGTVNFAVNIPEPLRAKLGRLATMKGASSTGAFVRILVTEAIVDAEKRGLELVREANQILMPWAFCPFIAFGMGAVAGAALIGENEPRRPGIQRVASGRPSRGVANPKKGNEA